MDTNRLTVLVISDQVSGGESQRKKFGDPLVVGVPLRLNGDWANVCAYDVGEMWRSGEEFYHRKAIR